MIKQYEPEKDIDNVIRNKLLALGNMEQRLMRTPVQTSINICIYMYI